MFKLRKVLVFLLFMLLVWGSAAAGNIFDIVKAGDIAAVKKFLKADKSLFKKKNGSGRTILHIAAGEGHLELVKFFLEKGMDVSLKEKSYSLTPLHLAARNGRLDVVKFLLKNGADLYAREKDNETAFTYAVAGKSLETVKFLVSKGARINDMKSSRKVPPVYYAVTSVDSNPETVKYLFSKGADPKFKSEGGWTLLHNAAFRSKGEILDIIMKAGVSPDVKSDNGTTPLHNAASSGNNDSAQSLIKKGADINALRDDGNSPLSLAVSRGKTKFVELLLNKGAKTGSKVKFMGVTPLHIAAIKGYGKIGLMLLRSGADFSAVDNDGNTPLFYACRYGNKKMAKILLKSGAKKEKALEFFKKGPVLQKELDSGLAVIWYLGHSGWAIKTKENLLIFDYWKGGPVSDTPSLLNGAISPEEIKDLKVSVFVTHSHSDHYMPDIFKWKESINKIDYFMGFEPEGKSGFKYLPPGKTFKLNGMEITTIKSTDLGVAFFVKVDGVDIFHSGDHANKKRDLSGPFRKEIDFLADKGFSPDIFFAPVSGCNFRDKVSLKKGVYYTIKKLKAKTVFPMHGGENGGLNYLKFAKQAKKDGVKTPFYSPLAVGDYFVYKGGKVKVPFNTKKKSKKSDKKKPCRQSCSSACI
ncbi:MAG: ankyrin repeat domain-containing protein [Acidobacteriota bacterium]